MSVQAKICENALVALAGLGPQHSDLDPLLNALLPHLTYRQRFQEWAPIADAEQARRISGQIPPPRGDAERAHRAEQDAAQQIRDACAQAAATDQQAARARSYPAGVR